MVNLDSNRGVTISLHEDVVPSASIGFLGLSTTIQRTATGDIGSANDDGFVLGLKDLQTWARAANEVCICEVRTEAARARLSLVPFPLRPGHVTRTFASAL